MMLKFFLKDNYCYVCDAIKDSRDSDLSKEIIKSQLVFEFNSSRSISFSFLKRTLRFSDSLYSQGSKEIAFMSIHTQFQNYIIPRSRKFIRDRVSESYDLIFKRRMSRN